MSSNSQTSETQIEEALARVQKFWDGYASLYTETVSELTLEFAKVIHKHLHLKHAEKVLEVGAGGGVGSKDVLTYLSKGCEFLVTDYSPKMIEIAHENLSEGVIPKDIKVEIQQANALQLDYADNSIDRYIANLSLQLVPDHKKMLEEAKRVLKSDGIAGFSIWGRKESNGIHGLKAIADAKAGLNDGIVQCHPNFKLGEDLDTLKKTMKDIGFSRVFIWPHLAVMNIWTSEEFGNFVEKNFVQSLAPEENIRKIQIKCAREVAEEWLNNGNPIGMEAYIIIACV